jgi:BlaI family penicillinase repressor
MLGVVSAHDFGPLEMEVLGLIEKSGPHTVTSIRAALAQKGHALAYTTVMTVLSRLHEKGALTRRKDGKRFLYAGARGSGALKTGMLKRIKAALFQSRGIAPLTALLDAEELSSSELRELRRWVDLKLHERKP